MTIAASAVEPATPTPRSWRPGVFIEDKWIVNDELRFPTEEEARQQAADRLRRWGVVTDSRAMASDEPPNYRYVDHQLIGIEDFGVS